MQGTVLEAKDTAMNKADMIPALVGPHSKIWSFTSLINVTKEEIRMLRELVIGRPTIVQRVREGFFQEVIFIVTAEG